MVKRIRVVRIENIFALTGRKEKCLHYFWYGYIIYTLFAILAATENPKFPAAICQGFQIIGFVLVVMGAYGLLRFKFDNKYLEFIFTLYFLYLMTVVVRGAKYDFTSIKQMIFHIGLGVLPYFTPLIVLLPRNFAVYKRMFATILILGGFYIIFVISYYAILTEPDIKNTTSLYLAEVFTQLMVFPLGYFLLTFRYHLRKRNLFALALILLALFVLIVRARRGSMFICISTLLCSVMLYFIASKRKILSVFVTVFIITAMAMYFTGAATPAMFSSVEERGDEDTRSGVEDYFYDDMSTTDWIFGKGFNGQYYCLAIDGGTDPNVSEYRDVIETGYLQIILTGGIVSLTLLLLILIPAIFMGLFNSRNLLSKGAAIYILLWIIYEYPTIGVGFMLQYILVWVSVGICYSKKFRYLSDSTIAYQLKEYKIFEGLKYLSFK